IEERHTAIPNRDSISASWRIAVVSSPGPSPQVGAFALGTEQAEELHGTGAGAPDPVRNARVELSRFARGEHEVVLPERQPQSPAGDVQPLVPVMRLVMSTPAAPGSHAGHTLLKKWPDALALVRRPAEFRPYGSRGPMLLLWPEIWPQKRSDSESAGDNDHFDGRGAERVAASGACANE